MDLRIDTSLLGKGREEKGKLLWIQLKAISKNCQSKQTSDCKIALKTLAAVSNTATSVFLQ